MGSSQVVHKHLRKEAKRKQTALKALLCECMLIMVYASIYHYQRDFTSRILNLQGMSTFTFKAACITIIGRCYKIFYNFCFTHTYKVAH